MIFCSGFPQLEVASGIISELMAVVLGDYHVVPILNPYIPGNNLQFADLVIGTGTLAPITRAAGIDSGVDPTTGLWKIEFNPPAGGWKWAYDGVTPAPPIQITGFALIDDVVAAVLYAVTPPLAQPILLNGPGLVILGEMSGLVIDPVLLR